MNLTTEPSEARSQKSEVGSRKSESRRDKRTSGTYAYKFLVNGTDRVFDSDNSAKKAVDGIENSSAEIK
jgi:hypothetical protein